MGHGVLDSGALAARHRVSSQEGHILGQRRRPLQHGPLHPAHIGDHSALFKVLPVPVHKVQNPLGVEAEKHQVSLGQRPHAVLLRPVHHPLLQGVAQGGLAHVHPHDIKILKSSQGSGHRPANQAQAHDDNIFFHNDPSILRRSGRDTLTQLSNKVKGHPVYFGRYSKNRRTPLTETLPPFSPLMESSTLSSRQR